MPDDDPASCFVQIIDQRLVFLAARLHTASMRYPLSVTGVRIQPLLCRLSPTAALCQADYAMEVYDGARVHAVSIEVSLAVMVEVRASCTQEQLHALACGAMLYHLHNQLRVELHDWTRRMGMPSLVIELMTPQQVREAALAALA
jgi:hypothetical protein